MVTLVEAKMLCLAAILILPMVSSRNLNDLAKSKDEEFYNLVSTLTPYDDVRGDIPKVKDCKPEAMWAFVRHGTRFPKEDQIAELSNLTTVRDLVLSNHAQGRGYLSAKDLEALRTWQLVAEPEENMMLTSSGIDELRRFGKRLRKGFEHLFDKIKPKDVEVKITSKLRTRQSAEAVTFGLLNSHLKFGDFSVDNKLIKNEKNCAAWKQSTKNSKAKEEFQKFQNTIDFQRTVSKISKRLGFENDLPFDTIKNMYDVCGFEYSWYHDHRSAPWCSAFDREDLKVMEFVEDLNYYYKSGYGNPLVSYFGHQLVNDLISKLSEKDPKVTLLFGHSSGNRKLLVALGLGHDENLSGNGYNQQKDRKWRSSYLFPFAANINAVRFKCKKDPERAIGIFVNENLVQLPFCEKKLCGIEEFAKEFSEPLDPSVCTKNIS